jgi:rod shape-determining protein MreD
MWNLWGGRAAPATDERRKRRAEFSRPGDEETRMARCIIAAALVTYALAVFQNALGGLIAIQGVSPDLLFLWTVCMGLLSGHHVGALVGFGCGLLEGGLQQASIGAFAISKTLSGFGAGVMAGKMFRENWLVPIVSAGVLTVVNEGIFLLLSRGADWSQAGRLIGLRALYHAALAPFAFAIVARARRALRGVQEEVL